MQDASKPIWIKPKPADKLENGADFSISLELKEVIDYSLYETMRS